MHAKMRQVLNASRELPRWFSSVDVSMVVPGLTDREISGILADLHAGGWVERRVRRRSVQWCIVDLSRKRANPSYAARHPDFQLVKIRTGL